MTLALVLALAHAGEIVTLPCAFDPPVELAFARTGTTRFAAAPDGPATGRLEVRATLSGSGAAARVTWRRTAATHEGLEPSARTAEDFFHALAEVPLPLVLPRAPGSDLDVADPTAHVTALKDAVTAVMKAHPGQAMRDLGQRFARDPDRFAAMLLVEPSELFGATCGRLELGATRTTESNRGGLASREEVRATRTASGFEVQTTWTTTREAALAGRPAPPDMPATLTLSRSTLHLDPRGLPLRMEQQLGTAGFSAITAENTWERLDPPGAGKVQTTD